LLHVQVILGWGRLAYDDGVIRGRQLGKTFNGLRRCGVAAFNGIDPGKCSMFRTFSEVVEAGYSPKARVGDTFRATEKRSVSQALQQYVF
jgi:hypothetical protein